MDPIISLCNGVSNLCLEYLKGYKNAPSELRTIVIEVDGIKSVLGLLIALPTDDVDTISLAAKLKETVKECWRVLESLENLLSADEDDNHEEKERKRRKIKEALNRGEWPFKREKVNKILEALSRIKITLTLGLTADSANELKQVKDSIAKIKENTEFGEIDRILSWLVTTDPSPRHNEACGLREEHTGEWLLNSRDYRDWREAKIRILWIHGIAGAGKTILMSHIFEDVKSLCSTAALKGTGFVYYYCHFAHAHNEAAHILRWIISQLCRQIGGIPAEVRILCQKGTEPTITDLIDVLTQILLNFPRVYVTIDALDESEKRDEFLAVMHTLFNDRRLSKISFLVSSRQLRDIEEVLSRHTELSMSNEYVLEDIRRYVRAYIFNERRMKKWPMELRTEVELALVNGARGMFRWVACQLDTLRWFGRPQEIRSALTKLPADLYETYERVLCGVSKEHKEKVARVLNLIASGATDLNIDHLSFALAVDFKNQSYSVDDHDFDKWAVIESCKCLVTVDPLGDNIIFAHYTVKEYLFSEEMMKNPSVLEFHLTDDSTNFTAGMCYMIFLIEWQPSHAKRDLSSATDWVFFVRKIKTKSTRKEITPTVLRLLDSENSSTWPWLRKNRPPTNFELLFSAPIWKADPSKKLCVTFAYLVYFRLFDIAKDLVDQGMVPSDICNQSIYQQHWDDLPEQQKYLPRFWARTIGFPTRKDSNYVGATDGIKIACNRLDDDSLHFLLQLNADPNSVNEAGYSRICSVFFESTPGGETYWPTIERRIKLMLSNGSQPRLLDLSCSPLQCLIVCAIRDFLESGGTFNMLSLLSVQRIFRELVDNGADINAVGCDRANEKRIKLAYQAQFSTGAWNRDQSECPEHVLKQAMDSRGESKVYDTPLRLLENALDPRNEHLIKKRMEQLQERKDFCRTLISLLKSHGARSLHLFPHPNLLGYCEKDMAEWQRLKESGDIK